MTVILKIASLMPAVIVLTVGVGLADAREPVCSCAILVAAGRVLGLVGGHRDLPAGTDRISAWNNRFCLGHLCCELSFR